MSPPRPASETRSGSLEPGRPSRAQSANTRHPAGRPHTPPADRMYATDVRQTDVRQQHRLMPPGRGIIIMTAIIITTSSSSSIGISIISLLLLLHLLLVLRLHSGYNSTFVTHTVGPGNIAFRLSYFLSQCV